MGPKPFAALFGTKQPNMFTFTRQLSDDEVAAIAHLVPDVEAWINEAINGKIAAGKGKLFEHFLTAATDSTPVPPTKADAIKAVLQHPEYKNRKERDKHDTSTSLPNPPKRGH